MIVLALGQKGSGKSRLVRQLVAGRLARWPKCSALVHDPYEQWSGGKTFGRADDVREHLAESGSLPRLVLVRADTADAVCALAWDVQQTTCVIDELDQVCGSKRWTSDAARNLAHYGRHRQVDLMGSFRFTRNVNEDLPSLADFIFLLRHSSGALYDLRTVRQRFGDAYADAVVGLPDHRALVFHDGHDG